MDRLDTSLQRQAGLTPKSGATVPAAYPPHPPLQSGGWYRTTAAELPGPGRPPVTAPRRGQSSMVYVAVTVLGFVALLLLL